MIDREEKYEEHRRALEMRKKPAKDKARQTKT